MKKIILGRTEESISVISLGAWSHGKENIDNGASVGWSNQSDQDSKNALLQSFSLGINHWDTADVYGEGHSEKIIGSMWNEISRNDIFLATKVGWDKGPNKHWYNSNYIRTKMEQSLKNLSPAIISNYIYDLVKKFNSFYQNISILGAENITTKNFRLLLLINVARNLKNSCSLLGISLPDSM